MLHKLQELEKSLQSVNSAAGEVEKTVKAYADLGVKIDSYANKFENIAKQINQLCDAVNSNYSLRLEGMDKKLDELSAKFVQSVNQADSILQVTVADFNHDATSTTTSLTDVAEQAKVDLRRLGDDISNAFSERCDNAITSFKNASVAIHNDMDKRTGELSSRFAQSVNQTDSALQTTITDFNHETKSATTSLADVAEQTKVDLRRLSDDISGTFSERCDNAITSFKNASDAIHNDMDRLISSVNSTIGDSQRQLSELRQEMLDENKKSRKLSYYTMVLVAISIILSLCSLLIK